MILTTPLHGHAQDTNCVAGPAGLVAWWRAEGDLTDSVGGNNGQSAGDVTFVAGEVGQAFAFDGTPTSYIEVPDSPALQIPDELTIEFWVKRLRLSYPSMPYADYVLEKGGDFTGNQVNYSVALHNASYNYCLHFVFAGGWRGAGSIADTNFWHHCAVVARNGDSDPTFYIDGVAQPVTYSEGASVINLVTSTRPLHIGAMVDPVTGWFYYGDELVDELSIYHRALAAAEIQAIYNAGAAGKCVPPPQPPSIVSQPADTTVNAGSLARFSVTALGSAPLSYQWFFGSNAVSGSNQSSLVLSNAQPGDAGTYFVVVSNAYGTATSSNAQLTVLTFPPAIQVQPQPTNVYVGTSVTFSVSATGTPPLMFQWLKDNVPIPGATRVPYQLQNAQVADSGLYSVVVSNLYGSITSSNALLTVREPPPCVPPVAGLVSWWRGENNNLDGWDSNDGAGPFPPITYAPGKVGRCFFNSVIYVPDALSLHLTNALTLHAWVNGPMGLVGRTIISKYDSPTPTQGSQSSFFLGVSNGRLFFQVSSNGSSNASASLRSPQDLPGNQWIFVAATYDGIKLRLYTNASLVAQTPYTAGIFASTSPLGIGGIPDSTGLAQSTSPFNGYIDEVCIYSRALADAELTAIYNADISGMCLEPPTIMASPQDQAVPLGEDVKFTVSVVGSRPLRYQWFFNTQPMRGATNGSLVLERVRTNSAGAYSVMVSNALGWAQSSAANLTLLPPPVCAPPPPGMISWWPADNSPLDVVGANNAILLRGATYTTGKVGQAFSIISLFQPPGESGLIQVANSASLNFTNNEDFSIEGWVKALPGGASFIGGRLSPIPSMNIARKRIISPVLPGPGYQLSLEQGRLAFWLSSSVQGTNPPSFISSGPDLRDGMFHHVAVSVERGATNGGNLYVDGELVLMFNPTSQRGSLANTAPLLIGSSTELVPDVGLRGLIDELTIYNRALSADEILAIRTAGAAGKCKTRPFITQQPLTEHVLSGGTAMFTVVADGTPNLHYQWRINNAPLPGATTSTLTLSNVQINAGPYSVMITNGFGFVVSSNVFVVLNQAPVAVCQNVIVPAGTNCLATASIDNGSFDPDGEPITLVQMPLGPYPIGTNLVNLIATDPWGATNSCSALVVVADQTPPTVNCPPTLVTTNDLNQCGAVVVFSLPTATDLCSPVTNVLCIPPPGSFFPVGTTPVRCLAFDAAGNVGTCTFNVTVRDTQRPTITCPADIVVTNAHDAWTSVVHFSPTVSDNCPGVGLPICNPPSGSAFGVGTTTVTCSAIDVAGNSSQCTFRVVVHPGNVPPTPLIDVSPLAHFAGDTNLLVIAVNGTDARVTFDGSRSYDVDDTNFLYFWYEDGNVFSTNVVATQDLAVGSHTITLWLDDTFPFGTNSQSVTVEVIRPADAVGILIDMVEGANLSHPKPLLASLLGAEASFERGNLSAAVNQLRAFEHMVLAQVAPSNPALAKQLIDGAETILHAFRFGNSWVK